MLNYILIGIVLFFILGLFAVIFNLIYHIAVNIQLSKTVLHTETVQGKVVSKNKVEKDQGTNVSLYLISPLLWGAKKMLEEDKYFVEVSVNNQSSVIKTNEDVFLKSKEGSFASVTRKEILAKRKVTWAEMILTGDFKSIHEYSYRIETIS